MTFIPRRLYILFVWQFMQTLLGCRSLFYSFPIYIHMRIHSGFNDLQKYSTHGRRKAEREWDKKIDNHMNCHTKKLYNQELQY